MVDLGKGLTEIFPAAGRAVDLEQIKRKLPEIESVLKKAGPFLEEIPGFLEKLGLRKKVAFRNSIRRNPLDVLAEALASDLSALLSGYQRKDRFKPSKANTVSWQFSSHPKQKTFTWKSMFRSWVGSARISFRRGKSMKTASCKSAMQPARNGNNNWAKSR